MILKMPVVHAEEDRDKSASIIKFDKMDLVMLFLHQIFERDPFAIKQPPANINATDEALAK